MRLIDADALKKGVNSISTHWLNDWSTLGVLAIIDEQPTIDAVPVVRCGECGHYHSEDDPAYCDELCTIHIDKTDGCLRGIKRGAEVGYRAVDGERKENNNAAD